MSNHKNYSPENIEATIVLFCNDDFGLKVFNDIKASLPPNHTNETIARVIDNIIDRATKLILFQNKPLDAIKWYRSSLNAPPEVLNSYLSFVLRILDYRVLPKNSNMKLILSELKKTNFIEFNYVPLNVDSIPMHFLGTTNILLEQYAKPHGQALGVLISEKDRVKKFLDGHRDEIVRQLSDTSYSGLTHDMIIRKYKGLREDALMPTREAFKEIEDWLQGPPHNYSKGEVKEKFGFTLEYEAFTRHARNHWLS